jgi:hypothetical protein
MCRINKINLIIFSVLVVVFILNCVKREHSNPLDPKYVIPGSGPAAPSLSMPTNGSSIGYNKPLFKWSEVDRVGSYELFVADTSGLMVLQHNDLTISYYTASNPLSDRKYFWKVRSRDGLGNWGGWSATWSFTIDTHGPVGPSLSIPENGATIGNNKPSFEWNDVSDAVIYEIFVANNHNSKVIQDSSLIISRYIESSVLSDGKYTWRVRCRDGAGNWGEWSATWSFTIKSAIIASPDPLVFGNVPLGQSKDLTLSISNPSDAVLNVTNITSTNTQFSVTSGTSFSVAVGSSQNVTIRFTPPSKGNQSGELSISNNSSVNPKTVSLSGNGTAPIIAVLPDPLAFGSVPLGQSKDLNLSTSNPGDAVLTVTNITSTNAQFSVTSGTSFSMESGSSKNVTVRFTPS